ncbi:hypothetical protein [Cedecea davisae]|uniref:hypothetical protein n=1 Tax=Cedecea davisae TaxID=158484 RepID=UPI001D0B727D|nr:hypothetical protein [Cedecea davisae]
MNDKNYALAEKIRVHLQKRTPESLPRIPFNEFPYGCCSDSAHILAEIINRRVDCGAKVVSFNKGCNGLSDSHAWVEVDGQCLDITLDQFNNTRDLYPAVYVGPYLPIHMEYANGESCQVSQPHWLEVVVEDIERLIHE